MHRAVLLLALVAGSGCDALTDRSLLLRTLRWRDADMADIDRFPRRAIPNQGPTFTFHLPTPGRYDTLFAPITLQGDGGGSNSDFDPFLESRGTWAFLVVRRDTLVYERYFGDRNRNTVQTTFSVSKSLLSLATGVAIDRGWLGGVDDPATRYLPELAERDPAFDSLTVAHLLTMTSGIAFERGKSPWGDEARSYYHPDLRSVALSRDLADPPGSRFQYNLYAPMVLGLVLERASGMTLSELLAAEVWTRIGATQPASWSLDSRRHGFEKMESGFNAAPVDLAKIGRLYLHGGMWEGRPVVAESWVEGSVRPDSTAGRSPRYGYYWWLRGADGEVNRFYAEGRFGQFIYVVPDRELIIVRTGASDGDVNWTSLFERLVRGVDAVDGRDDATGS